MPSLGSHNRGEWSEFYALLKMITDKAIDAADENLEAVKGLVYPIVKVIISREYPEETVYRLGSTNDIEITNEDGVFLVDSVDIKPYVRQIFNSIKNSTNTTFTIPLAEDVYKKLHCKRLQGRNIDKTDITLVIHDRNTQTSPEIGFSIKSQLGQPSTLLNAGRDSTNFIYEIVGDPIRDNWERINEIKSLGGKLIAIKNLGCSLEFTHVGSDIFARNLRTVDTIMPEIIAEMLKKYYLGDEKNIADIVNILEVENPLEKYSPNYEFKIKKLLKDVALGMTPGRTWNGRLETTGGCIVVREDGELVCYNVYYSDDFEDFLFKNTKLETPGRSRHGYGSLYKDDNKIYMKLNLQIRFRI